MQPPVESECPCCGEAIPEEGYCTRCFKKPESEEKLDKIMAELVLERPSVRFPIDIRWVRIGRDPSNQIVLNDDRYTSRYHAWVTFEADQFWLEDLGSTNGTLLNGEPVEKREQLSTGDRIKIGETEMTFTLL
jgi:hypothetical protein